MKTLVAYILAFIVIALASCTPHPTAGKKETQAIPDSIVANIQTTKVQAEFMDEYIKLNGKVEPNETKEAKVFALVSGKIESVTAELGDYVTKGQLLAVIRSTEVAEISNTLAMAEANVIMAKKNMETTKDLYEGRLTTEQEYLNANIAYNKAISELNRANQVASITGGNSSSYLVKAPINGFIIEKNITNNSEVRQDNSADLFEIADLSNVWIMANVYETDMNKVNIGDEVSVKTLADPDKVYSGKINKIYNVLDPDTRTMKVRISMENHNGELKPEMFATVKVKIKSSRKELMIPGRAIVMENSKYYVVVREQGKLLVKEVSLIKKVDNNTFISGLAINDEVVINSQLFLYQALTSN